LELYRQWSQRENFDPAGDPDKVPNVFLKNFTGNLMMASIKTVAERIAFLERLFSYSKGRNSARKIIHNE
jgi:hypothetical protein